MDLLAESAVFPESVTVHRYRDGEVLAREDNFDMKILDRYDAPFVDLYRADLQIAMVKKAEELGVSFKLNTRVVSVDFERSTITTATGDVHSADLIIAADGLWSRCREEFLERKDEPEPTGDLAYRVMLKVDEIDDPELRRWISSPELHFWIGPGAHVVAYPIKGLTMYNIVLLVPDDLPPGVSKQPGNLEQMRALFANWDPL